MIQDPAGSMNTHSLPQDSPALAVGRGTADAFELKFQIPQEAAPVIENWARQHLRPDPHGRDGFYRITTVYCDTPGFDVFHGTAGFRRAKHRLRRYETSQQIFLEHKIKRGDRVRKRRSSIALVELDRFTKETSETAQVPSLVGCWSGDWFLRRLRHRQLQPTAQVAYERTAFLGMTADGPVRLTLDRNLIGVPSRNWAVPPLRQGRALLPGVVLVEAKYTAVLPALFRELLHMLPPNPTRASKYKLCVRAWALTS